MAACVDPDLVPKRRLVTGEWIPGIGMGTFGSDNCTAQQISDAVAGAIRSGYRLFDCASVYGNEAQIGQVFAGAIADGSVTREELFITSKVWNDKHGHNDVLLSCAQSIKDLRLNQIDLYFVHWPFPNYHAPGCSGDARSVDAVPFSVERFMATWRQMERLHDSGLVRHIGMSNMTIPKLEAVLPLCRIQPAALEMELHPSFQQPELFQYCLDHDILPIGFSPIGSPARPARDTTEMDVVDLEMPEIAAAARNHDIHPALVCLKWAVQRGQVPIPFSVHESHYVANLRCVTEDPLSDAEMAAIAAADKNCRLIKGQVFLWQGAHSWEDLWDLDGAITGSGQNQG
ncbi:MAG: aldo/keto reductase [Clostridia bacterium]|nr:aldo/keto reductase [Clostridia bacterium]